MRSPILYLACMLVAVSGSQDGAHYHRYVVVGAGPGGLQLAHYLDSAGRDYVVLEKEDSVGSIFKRFPRWRELTSVNKPHTGKAGYEHNQRHDWHSLLPDPSHSLPAAVGEVFQNGVVPCMTYDDDTGTYVVASGEKRGDPLGEPGSQESGEIPGCWAPDYSTTDPKFNMHAVGSGLLFKQWSTKYYPHADEMVKYVEFWASDKAPRQQILPGSRLGSHRALNIRFKHTVVRVSRPRGFVDEQDNSIAAVAQGARRFRVEMDDGQAVECTYLIFAGGLQKLNPILGTNVAQLAKTYWTHSTNIADYVNKSVLIFGQGPTAFEIAHNVLGAAASVTMLGNGNERVQLSWETHYPGDVRMVHANLLETYMLHSLDVMAELEVSNLVLSRNNATGKFSLTDKYRPCEIDRDGRVINRCFFGRKEFDIAISCPGLRFDNSLFERSVRPDMHGNGRHPAITGKYESINVPGLFFGGSLMHGHDDKQSSGESVHGFRYLSRALHRILEEDEQAAQTYAQSTGQLDSGSKDDMVGIDAAAEQLAPSTPSPFTSWPRRYTSGLRSLTSAILHRINQAAGMFHMFGHVGDVIVLPPLTDAMVRSFESLSPLAALQDPASFFYERNDPLLAQTSATRPLSSIDSASMPVIDDACKTGYFEEVPFTLIEHKAALWTQQTVQALKRQNVYAGEMVKHGHGTSSVGGVEYLVVTLEYGRKGRSSEFFSKDGWSRDPFAVSRANASLSAPEESRSLHPVIRYYHTGIDIKNAVSEVHLVEELYSDWTQHLSHILPVARFLQDVAGRRASITKRIAEAFRYEQSRRAQDPLDVTALTFPHSEEALSLASGISESMWKIPRKPDAHSELVRHFMSTPTCQLWYQGLPFRGGEGWMNRMSINATDQILYHGPRMMVLHFVDTIPLPPTSEEAQLAADFMRLLKTGEQLPPDVFNPAAGIVPDKALPRLTSEQARSRDATEQYLRQFYYNITSAIPQLVVIRINVRTSLGRSHADDHGVLEIPRIRVVDSFRGQFDIKTTNYSGLIEDMDKFLQTHVPGMRALAEDNDRFLFPGYTLDVMRGKDPDPYRSGKQDPSMDYDLRKSPPKAPGKRHPAQQQQQQQTKQQSKPAVPKRKRMSDLDEDIL